jgi:predicted phosphodiesterase
MPKTLPRHGHSLLVNSLIVADKLIRIFSDIHYGDRSSQVRSFAQLAPLFDGADTVVLNGDTLDTRIGPHPQRTAELRAEAMAFIARQTPNTVLLTGNHDPDISGLHVQLLGEGRVLVTHGDVLFDEIVPWGRDVSLIQKVLAEERSRALGPNMNALDARLELFRRVCTRIPQRHQVETNPWKHFFSLTLDTVWPPLHAWHVIQAWRVAPERAAALARTHRPQARFVVIGHTHRPGVWHTRDSRVIVNTGSFTRPFGANMVELTPGRLTVRRIEARDGKFHPGAPLAEFALAEAGA